MHIPLQHWFRPTRPAQWQRRMADDADRLLAEFGPTAYAVAADRSWREDVGLLRCPDAGHWSRVTLEIARRLEMGKAPVPGARPAQSREASPPQAFHMH